MKLGPIAPAASWMLKSWASALLWTKLHLSSEWIFMFWSLHCYSQAQISPMWWCGFTVMHSLETRCQGLQWRWQLQCKCRGNHLSIWKMFFRKSYSPLFLSLPGNGLWRTCSIQYRDVLSFFMRDSFQSLLRRIFKFNPQHKVLLDSRHA